jgi:hypothetical protein
MPTAARSQLARVCVVRAAVGMAPVIICGEGSDSAGVGLEADPRWLAKVLRRLAASWMIDVIGGGPKNAGRGGWE